MKHFFYDCTIKVASVLFFYPLQMLPMVSNSKTDDNENSRRKSRNHKENCWHSRLTQFDISFHVDRSPHYQENQSHVHIPLDLGTCSPINKYKSPTMLNHVYLNALTVIHEVIVSFCWSISLQGPVWRSKLSFRNNLFQT